MARSLSQRCWVVWLALFFAGEIFLLVWSRPPDEVERWFVPGVLGYEAGRRPETPGPRAFLTRVMGVDRAWHRHNFGTERFAFSHNLAQVFSPTLYSRHPDFFPLVDGARLKPLQGADFWNPDLGRPDVAAFAATQAASYFEGHPAEPSFALGVNDGLVFGESAETLALVLPQRWFRGRPDYSNLVFSFMNRAADELGRSHPRKYLGALAYYWAENAPDFHVNAQVVPFLTADRSQGYDPVFWKEEMALQDRWAAAAGRFPSSVDRSDPVRTDMVSGLPRRLGIYDYLYGAGFLIPRIHTQLLAENLRHARRAGFTDYYAEVNPNWGLAGPMPWLAAQLLLDPEQAVSPLLEEYYRRYFKEAAGPMRQWFELCEQRWMGQPGPAYWLKHYRNESQAILFPGDVCRQLRELLNQATTLAATDVVRQRVRIVSEAFGVTERFVAFEDSRNRVERLILGSNLDWRAGLSCLREYLSTREEFIRFTTGLKKSEPLAVGPFEWDDYLRNDPVAGALLVVHDSVVEKGELTEADALLKSWLEPEVRGLWSLLPAKSAKQEKELLRNNVFAGSIPPARRVAGLEYGVALPREWVSSVEPVQAHRAELMGSDANRILRISGTKATAISQWNQLGGSGLHRASLSVRGHVSPGTIVGLTFAWLDGQNRQLGFKVMRLPDGEWPAWVTLQQAGTPPTGAVWVAMGLIVHNQVLGDWVEAREFHLKVDS